MTEAQIALSRRAVACKGFRWMAGMNTAGRLDQDGAYLRLHDVGLTAAGFLVELCGGAFDWRQRKDGRWLCLRGGDVIGKPSEVLPDLDDPATLGCLLALVRKAWDDEGAYAMPRSASQGGGWALWACPPADINIPRGTGATEAEALVAALKSAP